jgi:hypothetical protein
MYIRSFGRRLTSSSNRGLSRDFAQLVSDIPDHGDLVHAEAMQGMVEEIIHSDTLTTYLTATNSGSGLGKITFVHSIPRYSAGFSGINALHNQMLGLLGEMRDDQLPMLLKFNGDPTENLVHALIYGGRDGANGRTSRYIFCDWHGNTPPTSGYGGTRGGGGVDMNLSNSCPIPLAWTPYFMDFRAPTEAVHMARLLVASLEDVTHRMQAAPLLDWM